LYLHKAVLVKTSFQNTVSLYSLIRHFSTSYLLGEKGIYRLRRRQASLVKGIPAGKSRVNYIYYPGLSHSGETMGEAEGWPNKIGAFIDRFVFTMRPDIRLTFQEKLADISRFIEDKSEESNNASWIVDGPLYKSAQLAASMESFADSFEALNRINELFMSLNHHAGGTPFMQESTDKGAEIAVLFVLDSVSSGFDGKMKLDIITCVSETAKALYEMGTPKFLMHQACMDATTALTEHARQSEIFGNREKFDCETRSIATIFPIIARTLNAHSVTAVAEHYRHQAITNRQLHAAGTKSRSK
jgi:hypothetical protein